MEVFAVRPVVFSKVLAARKTNLITARARKKRRSARVLANARKDHSIPLDNMHDDVSTYFALVYRRREPVLVMKRVKRKAMFRPSWKFAGKPNSIPAPFFVLCFRVFLGGLRFRGLRFLGVFVFEVFVF